MNHEQNREELKRKLDARLTRAIEEYTKENGLSLKEVQEAAQGLLLTPPKL